MTETTGTMDCRRVTDRRQWAKVPAPERIAYAHRLIILHPRFREAVALLEHCHRASRQAAEPICGALLGASGVGKTSVVDHYCRLHPPEETDCATRQPVLKVTLQPDARPKGIAADLLLALGDPAWSSGTVQTLTNRAVRLLRHCGVELIVMDEFHHLFDMDRAKVMTKASQWLKVLVVNTGVPVVVCGMPEAEYVLSAEHTDPHPVAVSSGRVPQRVPGGAQAPHHVHGNQPQVWPPIARGLPSETDRVPRAVRTAKGWQIPVRSVQGIEAFYAGLPRLTGPTSRWVSFRQATRVAGPSGLGMGQLLRLIESGSLRARMAKPEKKLNGIAVSRADLAALRKEARKQSEPAADWSLHRAARSLFPRRPVKAYVLKRWIRAGLLRARQDGVRTILSAEEIRRFRAEYCLAREAAQALGIARSTLSRWEAQGRITPVYGKRVTAHAGFSLYRRDDLRRLRETTA